MSILKEINSFENKFTLSSQNFEKNISNVIILILTRVIPKLLIRVKGAFFIRFQEFSNSKATLAFIQKPLHATIRELNFFLFYIDIRNLEKQLLYLNNKEFCSLSICVLIQEYYRKTNVHLGIEWMLMILVGNSLSKTNELRL